MSEKLNEITNGSFLRVNEEGKAYWGQPEGGSGAFIVNVTMDEQNNYIADKTYAEISEVLANGQIPYCIYGNYLLRLTYSDAISNISTYRTETSSHYFICVKSSTLINLTIDEFNHVFVIENTITIS